MAAGPKKAPKRPSASEKERKPVSRRSKPESTAARDQRWSARAVLHGRRHEPGIEERRSKAVDPYILYSSPSSFARVEGPYFRKTEVIEPLTITEPFSPDVVRPVSGLNPKSQVKVIEEKKGNLRRKKRKKTKKAKKAKKIRTRKAKTRRLRYKKKI